MLMQVHGGILLGFQTWKDAVVAIKKEKAEELQFELEAKLKALQMNAASAFQKKLAQKLKFGSLFECYNHWKVNEPASRALYVWYVSLRSAAVHHP